MINLSTGLRNKMLGDKSINEIFEGGLIKVYTGSQTATADDAVTGQLLVTITNDSQTVKVKQKNTLTAAVANATAYTVTLNGVAITYTSDATATADEISAGLKVAIDTATGTAVGSTTIANPKIYGLFTVVDVGASSGSITVESATAGIAFDITVTANITNVLTIADAYGLHFDPDGVASGVLSKIATETWSGLTVATGTPGYFRFVADSDDGTSSTTQPRFQGSIGIVGADLTVTSTNFAVGATQNIPSAIISIAAHK